MTSNITWGTFLDPRFFKCKHLDQEERITVEEIVRDEAVKLYLIHEGSIADLQPEVQPDVSRNLSNDFMDHVMLSVQYGSDSKNIFVRKSLNHAFNMKSSCTS